MILPVRQNPRIIAHPDGTYDIRDENGGPFGPTGVTQQQAEQWLNDPVKVIVAATLQDHSKDYARILSPNSAGERRCRCGADWADDTHLADMISARLSAAGLT